MPIKAVRGVHDILPTEARKWQRVEEIARAVFEAYGYAEIRLPIFERTEVFARGIGEVTDIVQKEMYTFEDRGSESLTLRPEATASLIRAYIEHGLFVHPKPIQLYTIGPMFRYERPQAGRYRQFHQINVEAIGDDHPALDAQQVAMLMEFFRRLGLAEGLELRLNSIGDAACRPAYRAKLQAYFREHQHALCEECRERIEKNPLRVLDCKNTRCQPAIDAAPSILEALCDACKDHFDRIRKYLDALGLRYVDSPRLVRGLDYYVRTTFEVVAPATRLPVEDGRSRVVGAQNAVAGGGRYDGLVELLGGPADPAIGFAIGMERVVQLLPDLGPEAREHRRPFAALIPLGEEALKRLLPVARAVRDRGIAVELRYGDRKLRAELDWANRLGVRYVVIVGEDELGKGEAAIKEMAAGTQRTVPLNRLVEELLALEAGRD